MDEATVGERHQFDEFGIRADQVADDRLLAGDHVDGRQLDLSAIANDVIEARVARHGEALCDCVAFADKIDHRFGAVAARQFEYALPFITVALDRVMRPANLRKLQRDLGAVDYDDFSRAKRVQNLNADVPQTTG